jgi:hypothetical protein
VKKGRRHGKPALELLEEATALLRRVPLSGWVAYLGGTLPFLLGLLFFWADMSRSAVADGHLLPGSLLLALLFIAMKTSHVFFLRALREPGEPPLRIFPLALVQAATAPWGLVVLPLALLLALPFGWCFAWFQNVTAVCASGETELRRVSAQAKRLALLWPAQNHIVILILSFLGLVVFVDLSVTAFLLPRLFRTLLGIETPFARSNFFLLNSTFWFSMTALSWLCLDPLVKATYFLRCRHGEELATGEDLLAELRLLRAAKTAVIALLFLGLCGTIPVSAVADPLPVYRPVDAVELERSMERVMGRMEYAWRLPREKRGERSGPPGFLLELREAAAEFFRKIGRWIGKVIEWLIRHAPKPSGSMPRAPGLPYGMWTFVYLLVALLAAVGGVSLYRALRRRRKSEEDVSAATVTPLPDLTRDEVAADELPEEKWYALARDLFAKGEHRLGLRALYLAGLSHLAANGLVTIVPSKSDREYERELARRARTRDRLIASFTSTRIIFEEVWYGMHPVRKEAVQAVLDNHRRIVGDAE